MTANQVPYWPGWETVRLIGRGSFGAVYEIQRKLFEDDEEVEKAALKVISIPQNDSDIEEMYNDGYDEESVTSSFRSHLKSIVAEYSLMRKMNGSANIVNCDDVRYEQHADGIGWDIYMIQMVLPERCWMNVYRMLVIGTVRRLRFTSSWIVGIALAGLYTSNYRHRDRR